MPNRLVLAVNQIIHHLDVPGRILKGLSTKIRQGQIGIKKSVFNQVCSTPSKPLLNLLLGNCDNCRQGFKKSSPPQDSATKQCAAGRSSAPLSLRTSAKHRTENRLSGLTSQRRINSGLERYCPSAKNCSTY